MSSSDSQTDFSTIETLIRENMSLFEKKKSNIIVTKEEKKNLKLFVKLSLLNVIKVFLMDTKFRITKKKKHQNHRI